VKWGGGVSATHASLLVRLASAIVGLHPNRIIRVAIDGVDGVGKTTLADALASLVGNRGRSAIRASVDDFHNPRAVRYARGKYSPDGFYLDSYDYDAFRKLLLDPLGPDGSGRYVARRFDHRTDRLVEDEARQAPPSAALIVDGIFLHRPELRSYWDLSIFLQVDFGISVPRGAARDQTPDAIYPASPAYQRYVGGQKLYLGASEPERQADIVIDYNDLKAPEAVKWTVRGA
jgi:uridine kinase